MSGYRWWCSDTEGPQSLADRYISIQNVIRPTETSAEQIQVIREQYEAGQIERYNGLFWF